jgi:hypothetical protein
MSEETVYEKFRKRAVKQKKVLDIVRDIGVIVLALGMFGMVFGFISHRVEYTEISRLLIVIGIAPILVGVVCKSYLEYLEGFGE